MLTAHKTVRRPEPLADQLSPFPSVPASESSTTSTDSPKGSAPEGQSAAYDPETGEINWDCPCLGGMADGPCGEEFKAAFACFVYSEAEPKGVDCVEKFRGMQDCFRKHPDVYGNGESGFATRAVGGRRSGDRMGRWRMLPGLRGCTRSLCDSYGCYDVGARRTSVGSARAGERLQTFAALYLRISSLTTPCFSPMQTTKMKTTMPSCCLRSRLPSRRRTSSPAHREQALARDEGIKCRAYLIEAVCKAPLLYLKLLFAFFDSREVLDSTATRPPLARLATVASCSPSLHSSQR